MSLVADTGAVNAFKYNDFLPSSFVSAIAQDQQNRIWFATSDWISSFDGYTVQNLKKPEQVTSLRPEISKLFFDKNNNLWIATLHGVYFYDMQHATYKFVLFNTSDILHKSNIVYDIVADKNNTIYFATRNGIYYLQDHLTTPLRLTSFAYHETFNNKTKAERIARCLTFDKKGNLWVGTEGNGLLYINMRDNSSLRFSIDAAKDKQIPSDYVVSLHEDLLGMLWIGTSDGVCMYDPSKSTFLPIKLSQDDLAQFAVSSISSDSRGNVFIGTNSGMFLYERNTRKVIRYQHNPLDGSSLSSNVIKDIFKDRSDALWIATPRGVALYEEADEFYLYQQIPQDPASLSSNQIQFVLSDTVRKNLYVGTQHKGLSIFNPVTNLFQNINWNNDRNLFERHQKMLCAALNNRSELLIGTENGILTFTPESGFDVFEYDSLLQSGEEIYGIIQDSLGNYYLSILDRGLFYLNTQTNTISKVVLVDESKHKDLYTNIKLLYFDHLQNLWIVFRQGGLVRYNPFSKDVQHYRSEKEPLLNSNTIWSLYETDDHHLLIGTINGVSVFDVENHVFVNSPLVQLQNYIVFGILGDRLNDAYWFATDNGLFRYKRRSGDLILFSEQDNLQGATFNYQSTAQLDNCFYFGGDNGLNEINVTDKIENAYFPEPYITNIKIDQKFIPIRNILSGKQRFETISLEQGEVLELKMSAFSYQKMWRNNYRFKLASDDSTYHYLLNGDNTVVLQNLKRGTYQLLLSASNSAGNWSEPKLVAQIHVTFPTSLKVGLVMALVLILSILFFVYKFYKRKKTVVASSYVRKEKTELLKDMPFLPTMVNQLDARTEVLLKRLDEIMDKEEPYLNKRFSKTQLAGMMRITEPQLSQLLKEHHGKGYTDYINYYRVAYFKKLIEKENFKDFTLLSIGIECGFNSKTSFYRVFKSFTGLTPSEYMEQLKQNK